MEELPEWMVKLEVATYELPGIVRAEVRQRLQEGCNVEGMKERVKEALGKTNGLQEIELNAILQDLENLQVEESFPYTEPSTLEEIRAQRPAGPRRMALGLTDAQMLDRIHGAWLGRAAGCILGKPAEQGWDKNQIDSYLRFAGALPLDDYFPLVDGHPEGLELRCPNCTRGRINCMPGDDDTNYTVLGLHVLETYGPDFTSRNVARAWLGRLPHLSLWGAERLTYRNLVNGLWPPESARHHNPYREVIGAQIRADSWGYAAPGWPEKAAEFAFRDGSMSHVKNGIYGEMFVAAMLAASFVTSNVEEAVETGLSEIPGNCRLAEAIRDTVGWCKELSDWEQVWARINEKYGHYGAGDTINNAALVVMALMVAQGDYETSIVVAVRGGWDTDCNGATAGSICGMMRGADALPQKWVGVLNDRLKSSVLGFADNKISELAKRSLEMAKMVTAEAG